MTFDEWAARNAADSDGAMAGYGRWVKMQRQFMAGLESHGITVHPTAPARGTRAADPEVALSVAQAHAIDAGKPWYRETIIGHETPRSAAVVTVTEQSSTELGPIAYTALVQAADGQLLMLVHDYPVRPDGMQAILDDWAEKARSLGAAWQVERPGRMIAGGEPGQLQPWLDYQGSA